MLRITKIEEQEMPVTLKLEGKVADQWASLLESECRMALQTTNRLHLDFAAVSYVDADGVAVVNGLPRQRVEMINVPAFVRALLQKRGGAS